MSDRLHSWPNTSCTSKARRGMVMRCSTPGCNGEWSNKAILPPEQARKWAGQNGWIVEKNFRTAKCPGCANQEDAKVKTQKPDAQKPDINLRKAMILIAEHYDEDDKCYEGNMTDAKIAAQLDLSVAFIAGVRDKYFGPAEDPRIMDLRGEIEAARVEMRSEIETIRAMADESAKRWAERIDALGTKLAGLMR